MSKILLITSALAASVTMLIVACTSGKAGEEKKADPPAEERIRRGEYLVNAIGCDDCHSPKRMGAQGPEIIPELRLSGYTRNNQLPPVDSTEVKKGWTLFSPDFTATIGPWGVSYAANITSDATGIGNWSEANFLTAIRQGKAKGIANNRDLLPPMPWFVYKNLTDEDLKSIFAYLKQTKPVENAVPIPRTLAALN